MRKAFRRQALATRIRSMSVRERGGTVSDTVGAAGLHAEFPLPAPRVSVTVEASVVGFADALTIRTPGRAT